MKTQTTEYYALETDDVLRFSGGHADEEQITCITSLTLPEQVSDSFPHISENAFRRFCIVNLDGQAGYWYGLSNEENSCGDATMLWVKISKEDYSIEEGHKRGIFDWFSGKNQL